MLTQMEVYKRHIDLHVRFHPEVPAGGDRLSHFFGMFGDFFRLIFCTFACQDRFACAVRTGAPFHIERAYAFEELDALPHGLDCVSLQAGCPFALQQAAAQLYVAGRPRHIERHKYFYGIHGANEVERTQRHFLSLYGPLLRDMFCSAVCPLRGRCDRSGGSCRPAVFEHFRRRR